MKLSTIANEEEIEFVTQMKTLHVTTEEEFDDLATLALQICKTPIATIIFNDGDKVLLKAKAGENFAELLPQLSFLTKINKYEDFIIVEDTLEDPRFYHDPGVLNYPNIRFFAATPIVNPHNRVVGQLVVIDFFKRKLKSSEKTGLKMLAKQASALVKLKHELEKHENTKYDFGNSTDQVNTVFQNTIHAVIVLNRDGLIVQWNPKAENIFGWTKDEAIGKSFNDTIISENFREAHARTIKLYEETGVEFSGNKTIEVDAVKKDNSIFEIELGISPTIIKGQLFYLCFVSDNTDRKLVTSKLDKQKEFYENILNKIPTDIAVFDPDHKYLFVNPGAIKNDELRKYIIGKDDFEYAEYRNRDKRIAEKRREKFLEVKTLNKEIRWEDSLKDPSGHNITHLRRLFPVHDEEGNLTMVIGFGIDITERKIMEEKQSALVKQLSAQNIQLVDFCNIVSHNLRAPLANMSMLVKFIEECDDEEEQNGLIAMLNPVIDNLHLTFNELVESIQIKQDLEIQSENVVLEDCLKRTIDGMELKIKECGAVLEIDFSAAPVIRYPSKYLYSIFHNLITNALKYHDPQRKPVIKIQTQKINDEIIFSVADNGLGIDVAKHKDNIFKIGKVFHRHPNAKGFGLFMTKTQVEAGGGRIWVESTPGAGAKFFVSFINQDK